MNQQITTNPAPLGLCGFALTTWLLSLINTGHFSGSNVGLVLAMGLAFGGTAQMIAGMFEFAKGNTFGFTAFTSYGAFWWSFALFKLFFTTGVETSFIAWYLVAWGTFTLMMFVATLTKPRALQTIFGLLTLTFYLLAIGDFTTNHTITHIGGYFGYLTALAAFYLASAEVINESFGRTLLPIGEPNK
ncbi:MULTISPECIES: acetate uptake transporter [Pasteurellaceae]|uniref:Acetate uptake transporter n=1 Tax=Pasteurella atlantica TaxID=2827233 RepID=A0AAW8CIZ8_9PAST|nr:acetate uptake transporter [Pasteurella atlantica]MBR0572863.1 acetate uptake transporter [Pasteurella atlantica]MDP8038791.1 acetate uptake transporter [Pasteurella atlantica]MDP8040882.1 acetate uptake transporter [Pasteurella atlantica]MDP8042944.1 acetate uptake transporter [Pasteurella atlantica]MDP8045031.1 acetate uptake transporter [Pasteurella atlantica]